LSQHDPAAAGEAVAARWAATLDTFTERWPIIL